MNDKRAPFVTLLFMTVGILAICAVVTTTYSFIIYIKDQGGLSSAIFTFDARAFLTAADMMNSGQGGVLYDPQAQFSTQQFRFPELEHFESLLVFAYPPFVAVALSPLASLGSETAYMVLLLVELIALLLCTILVRELLRRNGHLIQLIGVLGLWSFFPLSIAVVQGQFSVFLLGALLSCWVFLERGRGVLGGVCLSLLAMKPFLILLPLVALISMGQVRALFGVLIGGVALLFVGLMVDGVSGWISWFELGTELIQLDRWQFGIAPMSMPTLKSILMVLFGRDNFFVVNSIWASAALLIITSVVMGFSRKRIWAPECTPVAWGGMIAAMLLLAPHANLHDFLLLYVPCLALGRVTMDSEPRLATRVVILCMVTWIVPLFYPVMTAFKLKALLLVLLILLLLAVTVLIYRKQSLCAT